MLRIRTIILKFRAIEVILVKEAVKGLRAIKGPLEHWVQLVFKGFRDLR